MAIEPIEGIVMGAVQAAANAKVNSDYDKKLSAAMARHEETVAIASNNLYRQAVERTGGAEPLGWLYSGSIGSYRVYYTKQEYLQKIMPSAFLYDAEIGGWNKEWGDRNIEIAKAKRAYRARRDPQNSEKILATPLEEFYPEIKHWELPWERQERLKEEQKAKAWETTQESLLALGKASGKFLFWWAVSMGVIKLLQVITIP